jgi:hypothetical protein
MNFFLQDRIKETSRTAGTGNFLLDGAAQGFSPFADFYTYGDYFYYAITDGTDYEVGSGEYYQDGSNNALRRWPLQSTNNNDYVNFNAGTKEVFVTYAAQGAIYSASGVDGRPKPETSGVMFWGTNQIVEYSNKVIWDNQNNRLGIYQQEPITAFEIGGPLDYSVVRASGFMDGGSGVLFSGIAGSFSGGRQLEPFLRNQVNNETGSDAVIELSGLVSESILLVKQAPRLFFAGPEDDCGCINDYPTFRLIDIDDLPLNDLDFRYVRQSNIGISPSNDNISPRNYEAGMVALYKTSGEITYDSGIYYDSSSKSLAIGRNAAIDTWREVLDVQGSAIFDGDITAEDLNVRDITANDINANDLTVNDITARDITGRNFVGASGTFEHIIFTNAPARFGDKSLTGSENVGFAVGIGSGTMHNASGAISTIAVGHKAGRFLQDSHESVIVGYLAGEESSGITSSVGIGNEALKVASGIISSIGIGSGALKEASGVFNSISIGTSSLEGASGIFNSVAVGPNLLKDASGVRYSVLTGYGAAEEASGINRSTSVGADSLKYSVTTNESVVAGFSASRDSSDVSNSVAVGAYAAQDIAGLSGTVSVGAYASKGSYDIEDSVIVGSKAGMEVSGGFTNNVAVGYSAAHLASGGTDLATAIGYEAASGMEDVAGSLFAGAKAGKQTRDIKNSLFVGLEAGQGATNINETVYVGQYAGSGSIDTFKVVAIGSGAAVEASGHHNVYIGPGAGASVSGFNNIEIIASGRGMLPSPDVSGKLNIGNFMLGDMNQGRVAIGWASGLEPGATLHLLPSGHKDPIMLIDQQKEPGMIPLNQYGDLLKWRRYGVGEGDTIYHINSSGDTLASGYMAPTDGLLLDANVPTSTTNRLYNDMGTLKFNGVALAVGGGFSEFFVADGESPADDVTTGQTVIWSGISGIDVQYRVDNMQFNISAGELSGVFQSAVDDVTFDLFMGASGLGDSSGRTRTVADQDYIIVSGVSGIKVDLADYSGTGVWILGWDGTQTYSFDMTDGVVPADTIADGSTVTITGVSGIRVDYTAADNTFRISDDIASGVVTDQINAVSGLTNAVSGFFDYSLSNEYGFMDMSGISGFLSNEFGAIEVSGLSGYYLSNENGIINVSGINANLSNEFGLIEVSGISGIAYYASGQVDNIIAPTLPEYGSGIAITDNIVRLDPDGSGLLKRLGINDYQATIIGASGGHDAVGYQSGVFLGYRTGLESYNAQKTVMLGALAGFQNSGVVESVMVGHQAAIETLANSGSVYIGHRVAVQSSGNDCAVLIGQNTGVGASGNVRLIAIGCDSASQVRSSDRAVLIGNEVADSGYNFDNIVLIGSNAAKYAFGDTMGATAGAVGIGNRALQSVSGAFDNTVNIGSQSSRSAEYISSGIHIGASSNQGGKQNQQNIMIGNVAGQLSQDNNSTIYLGRSAGEATSGVHNSIFIGTQAGALASGNLTDVNTKTQYNIGIGYDAGRESDDMQRVIAIGYNAGQFISNNESSIYIGDYAGYGRSGRKRDLILTNRDYPAQPPTNDFEAGIFTTDDGMISIQDCIQGVVDYSTMTVGTTPISPEIKLHIGFTLGLDTDDTLKQEQDKLNESMLSITPSDSTQAAIKLYKHDQVGKTWESVDGTGGSALLITQGAAGNLGAKPGEYQIVNEQGFLCQSINLPTGGGSSSNNYGIAQQQPGGSINYTNGVIVPINGNPGTIIPCTNAGATAAGLAVYWNGFWWFVEGTKLI